MEPPTDTGPTTTNTGPPTDTDPDTGSTHTGTDRSADTGTAGDVGLLTGLAAGDRTALATAFDQYAPTLTRYAWALATTREDVEELVQDTLLTLWQKAPTLDLATTALLPWLLVVCRNHWRNQTRRAARHSTIDLPDDLPTADTGDHDDARDRLRHVTDEIAALPPLDRRIVELCLIEGHSYPDAARTLGLSVTAITQRVSRTRKKLKKAVNQREH